MPKSTPYERFQRHCIQDSSGCTLWQGRTSTSGYGRFFHGKYHQAHRWIWARINGPIPNGYCVMHSCDVRNCVNPLHLSLGTPKLNSLDMKEKGRSLTGSKHHNSKLTESQVKAIIASIANGASISDLAFVYRVSRMTITHISIGRSWQHITRPPMHNKHRGNQKLPDYAVLAIRAGLKQGKTGAFLAKQFRVSDATISNIKNRKTFPEIK